MSRRTLAIAMVSVVLTGCGSKGNTRPAPAVEESQQPPDQREAEILGREIFELVDRAIDYRGSHRGRPATSLRQMGVDSLTPSTARYLVSLEREPLITVSYRKMSGREIASCRGDSHILEEAALNGGRFTVMCTNRSGVQRPIRVGQSDADR
jgi:predicted small lipoprotein YifL